jgi:O-methyltransferase involved in polyketide biosynthesis
MGVVAVETLTNVQKTALMTMYGKALDARADDPILGDTMADAAVRQLDFDFTTLKLAKGGEISLPVRAKQLDGWTRDFLAAHPDATVLHLGCGLDTRVYRVDPGPDVRWYDIDLPEIIALRHQLYPSRAGYKMISRSITEPGWVQELAADRPVVVVGEGLVMHVPTAEVVALFRRIMGAFPRGEFVFDVYAASTAKIITVASKLGRTPVQLHTGLPQALRAEVPELKLKESVPFLTLPDLVSRMSTNAVARLYFRAIKAGFTRDSILHLRYRFG